MVRFGGIFEKIINDNKLSIAKMRNTYNYVLEVMNYG